MEQKAVSKTNGDNNNKSKAKTLDYVLEEIVGGAGRWQWGMLAIMYIITLSGGLPLLERENQRRKCRKEETPGSVHKLILKD
jgi:hypothetical protein